VTRRRQSAREGSHPRGSRKPAQSSLSTREREVVELLADGLSGAQIAERLVLSPETVRTHIRNAMTKLGASTRTQAVAIALGQRDADGDDGVDSGATRATTARTNGASPVSDAALEQGLTAVAEGLVSLWDVDGGAIYLVDDDGLALRRYAQVGEPGAIRAPETIALGAGAFGHAALDRRAQVLPASPASGGTMIAAPMLADAQLVGVVGLVTRPSRPAGRRELLLLQAFAGHLAEVVRAGGEQAPERMRQAMDRFRTSWATATRGPLT
jgi:DNA-binding CsgD family transcriptional regulator